MCAGDRGRTSTRRKVVATACRCERIYKRTEIYNNHRALSRMTPRISLRENAHFWICFANLSACAFWSVSFAKRGCIKTNHYHDGFDTAPFGEPKPFSQPNKRNQACLLFIPVFIGTYTYFDIKLSLYHFAHIHE